MDQYLNVLGVVPFTTPPQVPQLFLRISPPTKEWYSNKQLESFMESISCTKYCSVEERSKRGVKHHHMLIYTALEIEDFRASFKLFFPEINSGRMYNLQEVEDLEKTYSYMLKDISEDYEHFMYKGYRSEFFDKYRKLSKKKFEIDIYQSKLTQFQNKFLLQDVEYTKVDLLTDWTMLNASYLKPINYSHVNNYIEMLIVKRYGSDRQSVYNMINERFNYEY